MKMSLLFLVLVAAPAGLQDAFDLGAQRPGVQLLVVQEVGVFFGPVLLDPPTGAEAVRLWDHVLGWLEFPHVYEIQRPKRRDDLRLIAETFRPYLEARDWNTVQKAAP